MIERCKRLYTVGQQLVNKTVVKVEPLRIGLTATLLKNTWPGNGEAVGIGAQLVFHERNILPITMIVIVGHIAGIAVADIARGMRKGIPYGRPLSIFVPGTLNLIGRSGHSPMEAGREGTIGSSVGFRIIVLVVGRGGISPPYRSQGNGGTRYAGQSYKLATV